MTKILKTKPDLFRPAVVPILFDPKIGSGANDKTIWSSRERGVALIVVQVSTSRSMTSQRDTSLFCSPHSRIVVQNESVFTFTYKDGTRAVQHQNHLGSGVGLAGLLISTRSHMCTVSDFKMYILNGPARHFFNNAATLDPRLAGNISDVERALSEPHDKRRGELNLFQAADIVVQALYIGGYITSAQRDYHLLHSRARQEEMLSEEARSHLLSQLSDIVKTAPVQKRDALERSLRELLQPKVEIDPRFKPGAIVYHLTSGPVKIIKRIKAMRDRPEQFRVRTRVSNRGDDTDEIDVLARELRVATTAEVELYVNTRQERVVTKIRKAAESVSKKADKPVVDARLRRKGAIIFYIGYGDARPVKVVTFDAKKARWEVMQSDGKVRKNIAAAKLSLATTAEVKRYQNEVRARHRSLQDLPKKAEPAEAPGAAKW